MSRFLRPQNTLKIFTWLVFTTLLVPLVYWTDLLYPLVTAKALWLRVCIELALPFYILLLFQYPDARPNLKNPLNLSLIGFVVVSALSAVFGIDMVRSLLGNYERMGGVVHTVHIILFYFYLLLLAALRGASFEKYLRFTIWVAVVVCSYGFWVMVGLPQFFQDADKARMSSTIGNPIFLASYLVVTLSLALYFAAHAENKGDRNKYIAASIVQFIALFLTSTRGAVVALVFGGVFMVVLYAFLQPGKKVKAGVLSVLVVLSIIGGSLYHFRDNLPQGSRIRRLVTFDDTNTKARLIQWRVAIQGFKEAPVLGIGSENFNVVANRLFDRDLYEYDASWFDKPHNFILEILVTGGVVGVLSYVLCNILVLLAFWQAYKQKFLTALELCFVAGGVVIYQIQNLFVFDTISAGFAFFVLVAFGGVVWQEVESKKAEKRKERFNTIVAQGAFYVSGALVLVAGVFMWNISTLRILRSVNFAYAIDIKNSPLAYEHFNTTVQLPFMYDPGEVGVKYEEFAIRVAQDSNERENKEFVNKTLQQAIDQLERSIKIRPQNAIYWYKLGNLYNTRAYYNQSGFDPRAEAAINTAMDLAPNRLEPLFFLVQTRALQENKEEVLKLSERAVGLVPKNATAHWRLALAYQDAGRKEDAVREAEIAQKLGYKFQLVREFRWLVNYYVDKAEYGKVLELYETAVKLNPKDDQLYEGLAGSYAALGRIDEAVAVAHKVGELNPSRKAEVELFIKQITK